MKRVLASVALTLALSALPGFAGATQDLSLQDPPGAPHIGTAMCLPTTPGGQLSCPAPDVVGTVTSAVQSSPVVVAPVVVPAAVDAAYAARLHADLCAARAVFCDVDDSGKYLTH